MTKQQGRARAIVTALLLPAACTGGGAEKDVTMAADEYDWPEGDHVEELEEVDCPTAQCLSIRQGSTYCSVDPGDLEENADGLFATKSRITLAAGIYPVHSPPYDSLPMLAVRTALDDERCGLFFSPRYWDDEGATQWKAFSMSCDDHRGEEIALVSVTTPAGWQGG